MPCDRRSVQRRRSRSAPASSSRWRNRRSPPPRRPAARPRRCARRRRAGPRTGSRAPARPAGSARPCWRAARPSRSITAPLPPRGWKTPNSYSMNARMVNRLGQRIRRHAEILALEREAEPHARVREVALEVAVDRAERPQQRQRLQHVGRQQVGAAVERRFQHRTEGGQLGAVVGHEARQVAASSATGWATRLLQARHVAAGRDAARPSNIRS